MRMVLQQIAKDCVYINGRLNCAACQENPSSELLKHTEGGGCLSKSEFYKCTPFVYSVIELDNLTHLYNAVCQIMEVPCNHSELLAKAILTWLPRDEISKTIKEEDEMFGAAFVEEDNIGYTTKYIECRNPVIASDNWALKFLIRKTYFDLNMESLFEKKMRYVFNH